MYNVIIIKKSLLCKTERVKTLYLSEDPNSATALKTNQSHAIENWLI